MRRDPDLDHPAGRPRAWPPSPRLLGGRPAARAQIPQPHIPDINQRSGLLQRFNATTSRPTCRRTPTATTSTAPASATTPRSSTPTPIYDGGLYGVRLPARDTASVYPFFYGSPGQSTITAESKSWRPSCLRARPAAHPPAEAGRDVLRPGQLRPDLRPRLVHPRARARLLALVLPGEPGRLIIGPIRRFRIAACRPPSTPARPDLAAEVGRWRPAGHLAWLVLASHRRTRSARDITRET